jgi:3-oxoacyl-[acyl-carrier protein] reductase
MGDRLKGKVAAVTGSGQGIGRAIAIALAREGAKVVTNNRKPNSTDPTVLIGEYSIDSLKKEEKDELLKRCAELGGDASTTADDIKKEGGEAVPFFGNVADFKTAGKFIQTAVDNFGKIDILVNNAGTFRYGSCWSMSEEVWDTVTGNKPKSYFNTIRHASPHMIKQKWGRIINCSSEAWLGGQKDHSNYCAANAGVIGLTMAVARELYPFEITCNAFTPGAMTRATVTIQARFNKMAEVNGVTPPKGMNERLNNTPSAEALGPFIAYLATAEASYITGSVFMVEGNHIGLWSVPQEIQTLDKKEGMWAVDELVKVVPDELLKGYKNVTQLPPRH